MKIFKICLFCFMTFPSLGFAITVPNPLIIKDGQSFDAISFKSIGNGQTYFNDKLIFEGVSKKFEIGEISVSKLSKYYYVTGCSKINNSCDGYLINKFDGNFIQVNLSRYNYPTFLVESNDGRYIVQYTYEYLDNPLEDAKLSFHDAVGLTLVDTQNPAQRYGKSILKGLPQNFKIDDNYQFSFTDKSGVVKGDLLEYFGVKNNTLSNNNIYLILGTIFLLIAGGFLWKRSKKRTK